MADGTRPEKPIFCGNFEYDAEEHEILTLFDKFGPCLKVDMKQGFAFVYMQDKRDGEEAIAKLDGTEFGNKQRKLKVQWAKMSEADRKRAELKPSNTLFVVNFDNVRVTNKDLEEHFSYYGTLARVQIKKNFAFVEFEALEDAIKAFESCNGKLFKGRTITIEYTAQSSGAGASRAGADRSQAPSRRTDDRYEPRQRSPPPRRRSRSPVYDNREYDRRPPATTYSSRDPPPRSEYHSKSYASERGRYEERDRSPPRRSQYSPPPRDSRHYSPPPRDSRYSPPPSRRY